MYRLNILRLSRSLVALLAGMSLNFAWADEKDFEQPITVDSVTQIIDGKLKRSVFEENVTVNQGSLRITANKLEVIAGEVSGNEVFLAHGTPAEYRQKTQQGNWVTATASTIRYEVANKILSFKGDAEIIQDSSRVKGDLIRFDLTNEQMIARAANGEEERVITIFTPTPSQSQTATQEKPASDDAPSDANQ